MRIAATAATLLFAMTACSTTESTVNPYQQPNMLMSTEINQRIEQIPFQHREELVQNLLWLAQTGEQTIPALLTGLNNENPKVRSSCSWVLGRLRDRRTVPNLQQLINDKESSVRMEACRSLVMMGDLQQSPTLIEGLDSDKKEVRYMCHEALKTATGHDFGYDHLNQNQQDLQFAVLRWRQWWGEYAGDTFFASNYEQEHGLNNLAAPAGETKSTTAPQSTSEPQSTTEPQTSPVPSNPNPNQAVETQSTNESVQPSPESTPSNATPKAIVPTPTNPSNTPGSSASPSIQAPSGNAAGAAKSNAPVQAVPVIVPSSRVAPPASGHVPASPKAQGGQALVEVPAVTTPSSSAAAGNANSAPGSN